MDGSEAIPERAESILDQEDVVGVLEFDSDDSDKQKLFEAIRVVQKFDHEVEVEWVQASRPAPPDEKPWQVADREKKSQVLIFRAYRRG